MKWQDFRPVTQFPNISVLMVHCRITRQVDNSAIAGEQVKIDEFADYCGHIM